MSAAVGNAPAVPCRVAIVGAGIAGLTLTARLSAPPAAGRFEVMLVDKSRGPGGRCATRTTPAGRFDHGAGGVQPCGVAFAVAVAARPSPAEVGGMNAWARAFATGDELDALIARGVALRWEAAVAAIEPWHEPDGAPVPPWSLRLAADAGRGAVRLGPFDAVVVAVPAEQARTLLQASPRLGAVLAPVASDPCWTVMAAWPMPLPRADRLASDVGPQDPLAVARPVAGSDDTRWVLQATADWSRTHLESPPEAVADRLLAALAGRAGLRLARPSWLAVHRWRYAQVPQPLGRPFGTDAALGLAAIGDAWHAADGAVRGIERAWASAAALADAWLAAGTLPDLPVEPSAATAQAPSDAGSPPAAKPRRRRHASASTPVSPQVPPAPHTADGPTG